MFRAANALVALKPCFMMGPLSVAQYLAPDKLKFDLVVMDEASQLKPEDAIGALARGGQVVIIGDPKQLPPTTFFQRVSLDGDEDEEDSRTAVEEGESILDVASTLFQPVRRLRWHYHSKHHSLIAFSNNGIFPRGKTIGVIVEEDHPHRDGRSRPILAQDLGKNTSKAVAHAVETVHGNERASFLKARNADVSRSRPSHGSVLAAG